MKIIRSVESNGRFVIPKEMREKLDLVDEEELEITLFEDMNQIVIRKIGNNCALCGTSRNLKEISGKYLCRNCINVVKHMDTK